jgi:cytochrome o ubiquinol oxidase subunit 2
VPQLGGQIMAMTGMESTLYLDAYEPGDYQGMSANYSGDGFSKMQFTVRAADPGAFGAWVQEVRGVQKSLTTETYRQLAEPSTNEPAAYYGFADGSIFTSVVHKYSGSMGSMNH